MLYLLESKYAQCPEVSEAARNFPGSFLGWPLLCARGVAVFGVSGAQWSQWIRRRGPSSPRFLGSATRLGPAQGPSRPPLGLSAHAPRPRPGRPLPRPGPCCSSHDTTGRGQKRLPEDCPLLTTPCYLAATGGFKVICQAYVWGPSGFHPKPRTCASLTVGIPTPPPTYASAPFTASISSVLVL